MPMHVCQCKINWLSMLPSCPSDLSNTQRLRDIISFSAVRTGVCVNPAPLRIILSILYAAITKEAFELSYFTKDFSDKHRQVTYRPHVRWHTMLGTTSFIRRSNDNNQIQACEGFISAYV